MLTNPSNDPRSARATMNDELSAQSSHQKKKRRGRAWLVALAVFFLALSVFSLTPIGTFWWHSFTRHGGYVWIPVDAQIPRLSASMRFALAGNTAATPGPLAWKEIQPGFEVAELPVLVDAKEVDRIYLARIDPAHYRFEALNAPTGKGLIEWMRTPGVALVVNGSYYAHAAEPDTPFISQGKPLGPATYEGKGGVFASAPGVTHVVNLAGQSWPSSFHWADNAFICYPLLLDKGVPYSGVASQWLANRSFVGEDTQGRILIGTTTDGFFSLYRFGQFLAISGLNLDTALNLDGGPVACQGISLAGYERRTLGQWELQYSNGRGQLLTSFWGTPEMPIVLAAFPK
jgi:hypothetical protein